jgi:hypothetical protein
MPKRRRGRGNMKSHDDRDVSAKNMARILGIETNELIRLAASGAIPTIKNSNQRSGQRLRFDPFLVKKSLQSISLHQRYSKGSST